MSVAAFTVAVIAGLMIAEWRVSIRHERDLLARGAIAPREPGYPVMAILYPCCFLAMGIEGAARHAGVTFVFGSGVVLFVAGKAIKYWAMATLGERWTFKVHVLPGVPLVAAGPYRYLAHPNYVGLLGELAGTALMTAARITGPLALLAFGVVLWRRVRFEERALSTHGRT